MALTDQQRGLAANALLQAELTRQWIEPITFTWPETTIDDAYAIGQLVTQAKLELGRSIQGHKVGYTSAAMREAFGASEPDYGTLFDNWFLEENTDVPMQLLHRPWVEIELMFRLGSDLGGPDVSADDVLRATEYVQPAIEIVDSRLLRDGEDGGVIDSIADGASCGLVMIGGNRFDPRNLDPRHVGGALYLNGEVAETGTGAAVMGNPIHAVSWLARKYHEFGVTMKAGHAILSGSFIAAREIGPGDSVLADFGALGQIGFKVTE